MDACPRVDAVTPQPETGRATAAFVRRKVPVGGFEIAYREELERREQPALVFVHGLGMSSRAFRPVLPHLSDDFHVLAPDLPGCGGSSQPDHPMTVDEIVEVIDGWLTAVGVRQAAFVGHSLGGQVVTHLAARHPDRVTAAVLVAATPDPDVAPAWRKAWWLLVDGFLEPPSLVAEAARDYLQARPGRMWRTLRRALRADVEQRASRVQVPVLVVRGTRDRVVRDAWSRKLTAAFPYGRYLEVEGGTHGLPSQSPEVLAALVLAFLTPSAPSAEEAFVEPTERPTAPSS